jgi:hypothetical protein
MMKLIGYAILFFVIVSVLLDCMGGRRTPQDAGKEVAKRFDPTQLPQDAARQAQLMSQRDLNECLRTVAREQRVSSANCALIEGKTYEMCMKKYAFGPDHPDAWAAAQKRCYIGSGQTEIDDTVLGYGKALLRSVLCPWSKEKICADVPEATGTPYQQCLQRTVTDLRLGGQSQTCRSATTQPEWETCMVSVLCPQPNSRGCEWAVACKSSP